MRQTAVKLSITAVIAALLAVVAGMVLSAPAQAAVPASIFGTATPAIASDTDTGKVELGVQFRTAVGGQAMGVRFYKGTRNTGAHVGYLYAGSTRIASVGFTAETASGWQQASFRSPISIEPGQLYTVSYLAPQGRYAVNNPYTFPKTTGSLTAVKGVYRYGGGYPSSTYQASNYWVDLMFTATGSTPTTTTIATPTSTSTSTATPTSTVAPTTTTTTTSTVVPTTTPPTTGWPGATTTGVPAGVTLTNSGSLTISTNGAVIDALNVTGTIQINANNVTLKRTRVNGSGYAVIRVKDGATGVRIEDVEINGRGTSGTPNSGGVIGPATVLRSNIFGVENGVVPGSGSVIQDSWIHGLASPGAPHYDGVQMDGGLSNILVQHNVVDLSGLGQTGAIMVDNYFGSITAITVSNNRLLGAGYTVYCDGQFATPTIVGISFTGNRIAGGQWGPFLIRNCNATVTGNVNDSTGAPISG